MTGWNQTRLRRSGEGDEGSSVGSTHAEEAP